MSKTDYTVPPETMQVLYNAAMKLQLIILREHGVRPKVERVRKQLEELEKVTNFYRCWHRDSEEGQCSRMAVNGATCSEH